MDLEPINFTREVKLTSGTNGTFAAEGSAFGSLPVITPEKSSVEVTLGKFHGSKDLPEGQGTQHEKPWHRQAAFAFALGATSREVARQLEVAESTVSNLLRMPWFQKRVTDVMAEYGGKDIVELFRAEQFASLATIVQLRDDPKVAPSVRMNCAKDILDRALGKAVQRVESSASLSSDDPVTEVRRLEEENRRLQSQL